MARKSKKSSSKSPSSNPPVSGNDSVLTVSQQAELSRNRKNELERQSRLRLKNYYEALTNRNNELVHQSSIHKDLIKNYIALINQYIQSGFLINDDIKQMIESLNISIDSTHDQIKQIDEEINGNKALNIEFTNGILILHEHKSSFYPSTTPKNPAVVPQSPSDRRRKHNNCERKRCNKLKKYYTALTKRNNELVRQLKQFEDLIGIYTNLANCAASLYHKVSPSKTTLGQILQHSQSILAKRATIFDIDELIKANKTKNINFENGLLTYLDKSKESHQASSSSAASSSSSSPSQSKTHSRASSSSAASLPEPMVPNETSLAQQLVSQRIMTNQMTTHTQVKKSLFDNYFEIVKMIAPAILYSTNPQLDSSDKDSLNGSIKELMTFAASLEHHQNDETIDLAQQRAKAVMTLCINTINVIQPPFMRSSISIQKTLPTIALLEGQLLEEQAAAVLAELSAVHASSLPQATGYRADLWSHPPQHSHMGVEAPAAAAAAAAAASKPSTPTCPYYSMGGRWFSH